MITCALHVLGFTPNELNLADAMLELDIFASSTLTTNKTVTPSSPQQDGNMADLVVGRRISSTRCVPHVQVILSHVPDVNI